MSPIILQIIGAISGAVVGTLLVLGNTAVRICILLALGLLLIVGVAHAGEATRCADTSAWARYIMEARQDGEPIERAYEMVGDVPMLQELVLQAYTRPRFLSYGFQVAEIDEFSNKTFMQCVRGEK